MEKKNFHAYASRIDFKLSLIVFWNKQVFID